MRGRTIWFSIQDRSFEPNIIRTTTTERSNCAITKKLEERNLNFYVEFSCALVVVFLTWDIYSSSSINDYFMIMMMMMVLNRTAKIFFRCDLLFCLFNIKLCNGLDGFLIVELIPVSYVSYVYVIAYVKPHWTESRLMRNPILVHGVSITIIWKSQIERN